MKVYVYIKRRKKIVKIILDPYNKISGIFKMKYLKIKCILFYIFPIVVFSEINIYIF